MRFSKRTICSVLVAFAGATLFLAGCSNPDEQPSTRLPAGEGKGVNAPKSPPREVVERQAPVAQPGHEISYKVVQSIFDARCMPCHSAQNHKGGIDLSNYTAVMADHTATKKLIGSPVIVSGDSAIVGAIMGYHPIMPKGAKPLAPGDLTAITSWIHAGAHNN